VKYTTLFSIIIALVSCCKPSTYSPDFEKHVEYLASDELEGREVGSPGEEKAYTYLIEQFKDTGLKPLGENDTYLQEFDFLASREIGDSTSFKIGDTEVSSQKFYPLNFSASGTVSGETVNAGYGIFAPELSYDDYKKKNVEGKDIFIISISSPDGIHPHSKYLQYHDLKERARMAADRGAKAVIFFNNDPNADDPRKEYNEKVTPLDIPVIFVNDPGVVENALESEGSIRVELKEVRKTGHNVIAWLDNGADTYAILGAHYDHLGYGDGGNSLYRGKERMIHNGADDNASGTAMVLELAKGIKSAGLKKENFVFILFSGEERGLVGSKYFTEHPTCDLSRVKYMFNMDMVGRLDTAKNAMSVMGAGTSPEWDSLISIQHAPFNLVESKSGVGPSDYTSFYLKDIPVLGFFTGTHSDYHKPTDDPETLNYAGMNEVYDLILNMIRELDNDNTIAFSKTADDNARSTPRFTVTLGIVPDYVFEGKGLKIDGVSEGKPGAAAGLEKGDVIIRMGNFTIDDIYAYMNSLSQFKNGDEIEIEVLRNGENKILKATL